MKPIKILILGLVLSFLVIGATYTQVSATDLLPPLTNLKAVVTEDKMIQVTWDFPLVISNVNKINIYVTRDYAQVNPDAMFNGIPNPINTWYYTPNQEHRYYFFVTYELDGDVSQNAYTWVDYKTPAAPANLKVSNLKWYGAANLSWLDVNNTEDAWIIDVNGIDKNNSQSHRRIDLLPNDDTNVEQVITSPLDSEGYYTFKVWAKTGGLVSPAKEVSTYIPMCAPSQVTAESRRWDSGPGVELAWQDNSYREDCFQIERTNPDGTKTFIEETLGDGWWPDEELQYGAEYTYRIRAINHSKPVLNSAWSDPVSATTPRRLLQINPGTLSSIAKPSRLIDIHWVAVTPEISSDNDNQDTSSPAPEADDQQTSPTPSATLDADDQQQEQTPATTGNETIIRLYIGKMDYYVGSNLQNMDTAPVIMEERTLLPIRYVAEPLGASVQWDDVNKKVTIILGDKNIELWINQSRARVNGQDKMLDELNSNVVPIIGSTGRTMLPLRFIAENLGCQVGWNPSNQEVTITYPAQ